MLHVTGVPIRSESSPLPALRDGSNPIERKAVYRAQLEIKSMPASLVVQIALWPDKLADWAKEMAIAPSVVYNMLANVKPYHRVRTLLARRLDVAKGVLDHLIEAPRPEPLAKLPPEPPPTDPLEPQAPPAPPLAQPEPLAAAPTAATGGAAAQRSRVRRPASHRDAGRAASQMALNL